MWERIFLVQNKLESVFLTRKLLSPTALQYLHSLLLDSAGSRIVVVVVNHQG